MTNTGDAIHKAQTPRRERSRFRVPGLRQRETATIPLTDLYEPDFSFSRITAFLHSLGRARRRGQ